MKFFDWFQLQPTFFPDERNLRSAFLSNQKKWHPDFFINQPDLYQEALQNSSLNNLAYGVLRDFISCANYILEELGMNSASDKNMLPFDFLEDMLELSDKIETTTDTEGKHEIENILNDRLNNLEVNLRKEAALLGDFNTWDSNSLHSIKILLQEWKYLQRLKKNNANIEEM